MKPEEAGREAHLKIQSGSDLVEAHLEVLKEMVRIDSRSFNVNEFPGDRKTPTDMKEILKCAEDYLRNIGFSTIKINQPPPGTESVFPILLAEIIVSSDKPTLLCYAHLDKQPYMDDEKFKKWDGVPPTELRWNKERTRAYGRGAADDLSGVIAIGMSVDALLKSLGFDSRNPSPKTLEQLPCNIKVIFETEEESGSHSLIQQIKQNQEFFDPVDCVVITDVVNPSTGVPGLTISLRGIVQLEASVRPKDPNVHIDAQTALYKLLATLIHDDHSLALEGITRADRPVTDEENKGYEQVPTSIEQLREMAGLLPETKLTVPLRKSALLEAQLRKSFANARPGHRVAGSVIFGRAGARLTFRSCKDPAALKPGLLKALNTLNPFGLKIKLEEVRESKETAYDLIVHGATKDPHSGVNGGPFPVAELQLAKMIDGLINHAGKPHPQIGPLLETAQDEPVLSVRSLNVGLKGMGKPFDDSAAKAVVEIRLAPGNEEPEALEFLQTHLRHNTPAGFDLELTADKGASPWMTGIEHPVFPAIMDALEKGYEEKSCLYGCGGSIPFVPKLMVALGGVPPLCLGAYDPEARMHEPGESLSLVDLLGCARSIVHFMLQTPKAFPNPKGNKR
ncbi:MAG: M20/M25/M40 family metallo-hydrolase [Nitrospinaceae bacterium]